MKNNKLSYDKTSFTFVKSAAYTGVWFLGCSNLPRHFTVQQFAYLPKTFGIKSDDLYSLRNRCCCIHDPVRLSSINIPFTITIYRYTGQERHKHSCYLDRKRRSTSCLFSVKYGAVRGVMLTRVSAWLLHSSHLSSIVSFGCHGYWSLKQNHKDKSLFQLQQRFACCYRPDVFIIVLY